VIFPEPLVERKIGVLATEKCIIANVADELATSQNVLLTVQS
jgi:hypothetical protein